MIHLRAPPVTYLFIGASVLITLLTKFGQSDGLYWFVYSWPAILNGQVWRLITPDFVHFGIFHLLFNMLWLWDLGGIIEHRHGSLFLTAQLLVFSIIPNSAQYFMSGPGFGGMSGVVYGLFSYLWLRGRLDPWYEIRINRQTVALMLIWLVLCYTGMFGPIANTAHTAGLVVGGVWGLVASRFSRQPMRMPDRTAPREAFHECAVCRRTDASNPELEFRVGTDGREYCKEHLRA